VRGRVYSSCCRRRSGSAAACGVECPVRQQEPGGYHSLIRLYATLVCTVCSYDPAGGTVASARETEGAGRGGGHSGAHTGMQCCGCLETAAKQVSRRNPGDYGDEKHGVVAYCNSWHQGERILRAMDALQVNSDIRGYTYSHR